MKRLVFSLMIMLCLAIPMPVMAGEIDSVMPLDAAGKTVDAPDRSGFALDNGEADDRSAIGDVLSDWETNGYPDDIGGVFYDQETGRMTILLVNPSIGRETELSEIIPGVAFLPSVYSYNELLAVQDAITKEMMAQPDEEAMIYSAGIGFTAIDGMITGFGESGKEFRVVVSVDQSVFEETADRLYQRYGDMVYVEAGTAPVTLDGRLDTPAQAVTDMQWQFVLIALFLLAILGITLLWNRRHYNYALQTANGDTVTDSEPMSRKQVVAVVKEAAISPSDEIYGRIQKDLQERE